MAQTVGELEARLKAERAALDSLKARIAAEEVLLQMSSEASAQNQQERDTAQIEDALRAVQHASQDLARELNRTEQQLRQVESQLKSLERDLARRAREKYKIGRRGILAVLFSARSFRNAAQRVRYLSRLGDRDQRDFRALQAARKRASLFHAIRHSQQERQRILDSTSKRLRAIRRKKNRISEKPAPKK